MPLMLSRLCRSRGADCQQRVNSISTFRISNSKAEAIKQNEKKGRIKEEKTAQGQ